MNIRRTLALCTAAVLCVVCFAGCARDTDTASPSAEASVSASAEASESAAAESAAASPSVSAAAGEDGLGWFFTEWAKRLEQLDAGDMTEQPEISEGLSSLVEQSRDWQTHMTDDTVTLELPSRSVVVNASGSDTKLDSASIQCTMELTNLENGVTPPIFLFTLGAGALVEVMSGETEGGLETVNDSVAALLSGSSADGVITSEPVNFGTAQFIVSLDTAQRVLSLTGTPAA